MPHDQCLADSNCRRSVRKITNGFRTEWGAKLYADIRSTIETARRRAIGALEAIRFTLAGKSLELAGT